MYSGWPSVEEPFQNIGTKVEFLSKYPNVDIGVELTGTMMKADESGSRVMVVLKQKKIKILYYGRSSLNWENPWNIKQCWSKSSTKTEWPKQNQIESNSNRQRQILKNQKLLCNNYTAINFKLDIHNYACRITNNVEFETKIAASSNEVKLVLFHFAVWF